MNPLSAVQTYVVLGLLVLAGAAGWFINGAIWEAKWQKHLRADERAVAAAVQAAREDERKQLKLQSQSGDTQAKVQRKEAEAARTIIEKVPYYVRETVTVSCVSYGLVRVLDAAALGLDPAELRLPAGKSDDACTGLTPADLARSVASNYAAARADAAQLDGLIAHDKAQVALMNGEDP